MFWAQKKNKSKLIIFRYLEDGRRLKDGELLASNAPGGLWGEFFLRTFARRVVYDVDNTSDTSSYLDIVDLEIMNQNPLNGTNESPCSSPGFYNTEAAQFSLSNKTRKCSGAVMETRFKPMGSPCCTCTI